MKKQILTLLNSVTTNQTSALAAVNYSGKGITIQASIIGTGTVSCTVNWYGSNKKSNSGGELLATSILTGTTTDSSGEFIPAEWPIMYCVVSDITGTAAAVTATLGV